MLAEEEGRAHTQHVCRDDVRAPHVRGVTVRTPLQVIASNMTGTAIVPQPSSEQPNKKRKAAAAPPAGGQPGGQPGAAGGSWGR